MSVAEAVGTSVIKIGNTGPTVEVIQFALRDLGYGLKGTGYFGNATDTAVRAFQRKVGLNADGEVGAATAKMLDTMMIPTIKADQPAPALAEVQRPLWFQAGLKYLGLHEGVGAADNPTIIDWAKEEGGDTAKEYTHDSVPWCSLFCDHLLTSVGLPGPGTLWALDWAGKWPSVKLDGPAVGAFAPMVRNGGGHVICIAGRDQFGHIMGLGGNQSDQVSIVPFPLARLNKGFWWPKSVPVPAKVGFDSMPIVKSNGQISTNEA